MNNKALIMVAVGLFLAGTPVFAHHGDAGR
jgi:hypothetical protein